MEEINKLNTSICDLSYQEGLEEIIKNLGTIPTILTSIAAVKSFQNAGELLNTPSYALLQLCA